MVTPRSRTVSVLDSYMHYLEVGHGRPVLLLHGNPTSSHLWRHVLARAGDRSGHRWIAPDLIGMGASGKPELTYDVADQIAYVDGLIDALDLSGLVLVGHDWGVTIALDQLRRRGGEVRGIGLMEGHLAPLSGWQDFDEGGRQLFQQLRTPGVGEEMVLESNFFIQVLLPAGLARSLSEAEMEEYRAPYPDPASRRPLLQWARQIPVGGEPETVHDVMAAGAEHLSRTAAPVLLVHADPGVLVTASTVARWKEKLPQLTVADVGGPAGHFLPEDRPDEVADTLIRWVDGLP
jgi:haloalkane dehalogenase